MVYETGCGTFVPSNAKLTLIAMNVNLTLVSFRSYRLNVPFSNTVSSFLCFVLVVKVQVFHAVVRSSNPVESKFFLYS